MSSRPLSARIQSRKNGSPTAPADNAVRSMPEENARPSPVTTTTQASGSSAAAATAAASSVANCPSRAFSTCGRVSVIHPTPSRVSYRTCPATSFTGPTLAWRPEAVRRGLASSRRQADGRRPARRLTGTGAQDEPVVKRGEDLVDRGRRPDPEERGGLEGAELPVHTRLGRLRRLARTRRADVAVDQPVLVVDPRVLDVVIQVPEIGCVEGGD